MVRAGVACIAAALAVLVAGCATRAADRANSIQPIVETPAGHASLEGAPASARHAAQLYRTKSPEFDAAAASVIASVATDEEPRDAAPFANEHFFPLPGRWTSLSRNGGAWSTPASADHPGFVYFDNGDSDYPVADGLVYSTSPTSPPAFDPTGLAERGDDVLSTPTPVAPHWWAAAWDPLLFYNGISYDGRDYSSLDSALQIDPLRLPGPVVTVTGRSRGGVTYEDGSEVDITFVDVGAEKPVPVLTNPHTVTHPQPKSGVSTFKVRRAVLPGGRELAFALEAWD